MYFMSVMKGAAGFFGFWMALQWLGSLFPFHGWFFPLLVLLCMGVTVRWGGADAETRREGVITGLLTMLVPAACFGGMAFLFTREMIRPGLPGLIGAVSMAALLALGFGAALGAAVGGRRIVSPKPR